MVDDAVLQSDAQTDDRDPVVESSLSWPMAIMALLLLFSTGWAAYDEFLGRRPWKRYQAEFVPAYERHLQTVLDLQQRKVEEIEADEEYHELTTAYAATQGEVEPEKKGLNEQLVGITRQMEAITKRLKDARSDTAATIYKIETASSQSTKESLRLHLAEYHKGPFEVDLPDDDGGEVQRTYDYQQLLDAFDETRNQRSELRRKLGELVQQEAAKKKAMDAYMTQHLDGPMPATVEGQIAGLASFKHDITSHQIHVEEAGLVDRCEVCHLAIRSPVEVTAEQIRDASGKISESMAKAFTSHPRIEISGGDLLKIHPPDKFGCTPCHDGNGRALTSTEYAHGRYKHWLWPMYEEENAEAGCVRCPQGALYLEGAATLSRGRYLFLRLGCWGCHPRDGYDTEADWLIKFLRNPALSDTKPHRNGARMYLDIRMPTYKVSEEEIGKLVRFLDALSKQPSPYPFEKLDPLNEDELADARALFQVGKCLSCHVTSDDPRTFTSETKAPSYLVGAERLKPRWMRHWLRDPDQVMPGTVMPAFFKEIDGRWRATVLPEDRLRVKDADQVELMVRYQKFFDPTEAEYWLRLEKTGE